MVLYVILAFVAILVGMAISVYAFGTGGKRKKIFQDIYFSVENSRTIPFKDKGPLQTEPPPCQGAMRR